MVRIASPKFVVDATGLWRWWRWRPWLTRFRSLASATMAAPHCLCVRKAPASPYGTASLHGLCRPNVPACAGAATLLTVPGLAVAIIGCALGGSNGAGGGGAGPGRCRMPRNRGMGGIVGGASKRWGESCLDWCTLLWPPLGPACCCMVAWRCKKRGIGTSTVPSPRHRRSRSMSELRTPASLTRSLICGRSSERSRSRSASSSSVT
mmetsp:Transcript_136149/g.264833  ORF Transcript_136149/g.264833 Transcript_136149/m.264833 type:complete len:207 (+) Transcript_136149:183-803(+)